MLFDLQDYRFNGVIGANQTPISQSIWEDMATTGRATRDAFDKAVGEYILAVNVATSPCSDKLTDLLQQRLDTYAAFVEIHSTFWEGLANDTATAEQYSEYDKALKAYVKTVRSILSILDGDKFKVID